ncbi:hypothetical protein Tco_0642976, partial [Tanacetum coccineum]
DHPLKHMEHRAIFDSVKNSLKWDMLLLEEVKVVSVEKICDKKLNVLFTEKECLSIMQVTV